MWVKFIKNLRRLFYSREIDPLLLQVFRIEFMSHQISPGSTNGEGFNNFSSDSLVNSLHTFFYDFNIRLLFELFVSIYLVSEKVLEIPNFETCILTVLKQLNKVVNILLLVIEWC